MGTNISIPKTLLKMMFLYQRWDMFVPWRVYHLYSMLASNKSVKTDLLSNKHLSETSSFGRTKIPLRNPALARVANGFNLIDKCC